MQPAPAPYSHRDRLRRLKRLIRVGLPLSDLPGEQSPATALKTAISRVIEELAEHDVMSGSLSERLQYLTLRAEFEFNSGRGSTAITALRQFVDSAGLRDRLAQWAAQQAAHQPFRFQAENDASLLRQKIWALLGVAFYQEYLNGHVVEAIEELKSISRLIEEELLPMAAYAPHGSRSRVAYFLAQCYRSVGDFRLAEDHFLDAQKHAGRRLTRELAAAGNDPEKLQYEYQFGVICTARILGSLGRVAMLRGKQHRALQHLCAARTLLVPSGQEFFKMVLDSHIAIAEHRLTDPSGNHWRVALKEVELWYERFEAHDDLDGMRRCTQELARAWIDRAESRAPGQRDGSLRSAEKWIDALERVAGRRRDGRENPDILRVHVLRAWWSLLLSPPNIDAAKSHLEAAKKIEESQAHRHHFDLAGFDNIQVGMIEGILLDVAGSGEASSYFRKLRDDAREWNDRVLEAEALLRMAIAEFREKRTYAARKHLRQWRSFAPHVENAALHRLYRGTLRAFAEPSWQFPSQDMDLDRELENVTRFLGERALEMSETDREAAAMLNISPGRMKKLKKDWAEQDRT